MNNTAAAILFLGEPDSITHDHIGSLLSILLLNAPCPSASYNFFDGDLLAYLRSCAQNLLNDPHNSALLHPSTPVPHGTITPK
jgi:hypothetical protein